ncbi:hypothetical protein CDL12_22992 [Handroanthus impetiginosus]|uniref:FAF domain-containing protein n=1 Tax=Handroanthus impetiginosus TaxID=429701 RepID=A0A2G9GGQ7_9LAMI|nr:hypothetical protein CDL12_22992 [Handroanthus impetiginosus]
MSTIICQNLVTCFEPQLTETTTTLKLRVAPPAPATSDSCRKQESDDHHLPSQVKTIIEFGNWGSLQSTTKESSFEKEKNSYTHPLATKSSFSKLSAKSLQLCTENLGSETGTDIIAEEGGGATIFPGENSSGHRRSSPEKLNSRRKIKSFPPPLTTISGGKNSLRVYRHTEGGRLIIEAVEAPIRSSCFQAERSEGRLKLCFWTGSDTAASGGEEVENGECGVETTAEEEIDEPINEFELEKEEYDGEMKMEMGIEKMQRVRRCHGNRGFCSSNLKRTLWVATS